MSKNSTNNRISYGQYKAADILMFLLIMCVCEAINIFAVQQWFSGMLFSVSIMLLVSLVVIIRWGLIGVIFPVVDGLLYCALLGAEIETFVIYAVGNAFIIIIWFLFKVLPKEKIVSSWFLTIVYAAAGFVLLILGRSLVGLCFGENFLSTLLATAGGELLNFTFAVIGLLILRKIDSMLVDQKTYLERVTTERDTIKPAESDYHWDGYTELDPEDLKRLTAMDEYDRKVTFNRTSLKQLKENSGEYIDPEDMADSSDEDDLSRLDGE